MAISTISTHPKFKISKNPKVPHFYPRLGGPGDAWISCMVVLSGVPVMAFAVLTEPIYGRLRVTGGYK